ncbi:hypothetical protein [Sinorhizobium meliloti]|nr:hypothetical protein [Sinorhizobium meliloti]
MTTYDHIQELRAELAASIDAGARQQIWPSWSRPWRNISRRRPHSMR